MTARALRTPAGAQDLALFVAHLERTERFSDRLRETRCHGTGHFQRGLRDTLGVLSPLTGAWNMEVLFVLHITGPLRFNRLLETLAPISPRVLTDKLRHLEANRLVARSARGDHVAYTLTEHGRRTARLLHPLLYYLHNAPHVDGDGGAHHALTTPLQAAANADAVATSGP